LTSINSGSMAYAWTFGDGSSSSATSPSHSYSVDDTFLVKLVVNSNLSCTDSAFKTTYVFPSPVPEFSINDSSQCYVGNNFIFTNTSSIKWGNLTYYYWDFGDNGSANSSNSSHSYITSDTSFQVKMIVGTSLSCTDSIYKTVYIRPMPNADFIIWDSSQCLENNAFGFQNMSSITSGTITYLWDFDDGSSSTSVDPVHTFGYADTFLVKLTASSDFSCKDSISKNTYIHVHPEPVASFIMDDSTQCLKWNDFLFTNKSTISSGTFTQNWYLGDNTVSSDYSLNHSYLNHDTFTVKLMIISDYLCKDSVLHTAIVYPMPVMGYDIDDSSQCMQNNSFHFTDTTTIASGTFSSIWYFGNGDTSSKSNPDNSYGNPDTFPVTLISSSTLGCIDTVTKNVYVHPMPVANFSVNDTAQSFKDNNFIFTNNSSIPTGSMNYLWLFGDGNTSTQQNPVHVYATDDTFEVKLTILSDNGCRDSFNMTVYVFPTPEVDFSINDSTQCFNENYFEFTNSTTINWGNVTYNWYFGDGDTSSSLNTSHIYTSDDTFYVKLLATSETGAKDSAIRVVIVYPSPQPDYSINDSQQCLNENEFTFNNLSSINSGNQAFSWDFGDATFSNFSNPVKTYLVEDTFTVTLIVTSDLSCRDTIEKTVYVFPSPIAAYSINDSQQCLNENLFNFTNATTITSGNLMYQWYYGDGDSSGSEHPSHIYTSDDTFKVNLIASSLLGCFDTIQKTTYIFPSPISSFTINDSIQCFNGNQFVFNNNSSINSGSQSYQWSFGDGSSSSLTDPSHTYSLDDTFSVKLISTSNLNCVDTAFKTTYVLPNPLPAFNINDSQQCINENLFIFTNTSTINTGTQTYRWTFGDGSSSSLTDPLH
ncbi:MAG: PKD domain-containing protein, partial [Bacteroidetes bacterium]|nr:PKD domain-containing protein [Bacteroidota bacterium]